MNKFLTIIALAMMTSHVQAQPGTLDASFGTGGKVITDFGSNVYAYGKAVAIQTDGKILVAGYRYSPPGNFALVRYNTDGTLDNSFDTDGIVTTDFMSNSGHGCAIAIQADGKILVAGTLYTSQIGAFAMARYNTDGSLDNSFDTDGKVTDGLVGDGRCTSISIQNDGKILLAGYTGFGFVFHISRFLTNGSPDWSFGSGGTQGYSVGPSHPQGNALDYANFVIAQPDGKILAGGNTDLQATGGISRFVLMRANNDGTFDQNFGSSGIATRGLEVGVSHDRAKCGALQPDGKILIAGFTCANSASCDMAVLRFTANGILDNSFGNNGVATANFSAGWDQASSIAVQPDGKIILAGTSNGRDFSVARFNSNGTLDNVFDIDGKVTTIVDTGNNFAYGVALQPDGKIVVAGETSNGSKTDFAVVRYHGGGGVDITQTEGLVNTVAYPNPGDGLFIVESTAPVNTAYVVIDIKGSMVLSGLTKKNKTTIDLSSYAGGSYLLKIENSIIKLVKE